MSDLIQLHTLSIASLTPKQLALLDPKDKSKDFIFLMCKTVDWVMANRTSQISRESIYKKMNSVHEVYCVGSLDELNLTMCADAALTLLDTPEGYAKKRVKKFYNSIREYSPCNEPV